MNIKLYYTTAEKNEIGKLEKSELLIEMDNVSFKSSENTYNPTILIKYDPQDIPLFENKLMKANYVYIDILKKYYFITDVVLMTNNIIAYSLKMDVLETYRTYILNLECLIARNEFEYDTYLHDNEVELTSDYSRVTHEIDTSAVFHESGTNVRTFVITTIKGVF